MDNTKPYMVIHVTQGLIQPSLFNHREFIANCNFEDTVPNTTECQQICHSFIHVQYL